MLALTDVRSMTVWKYHPTSRVRSKEVQTDSQKLFTALQKTFETASTAEYHDPGDSGSPRYFIRFIGSSGLLTAGEVLRNYAFLGNEWLYTPRSRIWTVLEQLVGDK